MLLDARGFRGDGCSDGDAYPVVSQRGKATLHSSLGVHVAEGKPEDDNK